MITELVSNTQTAIDTSHTDASSRLRLSGLTNLLIQAAIKSADELGFGFKDLEEQQLIWVLSRLTIEIIEPLKWYDTAVVETWPKDIDRLFYLRDFTVRNQHGTIVAKAASAWLAIDLKSRRPKVMNKEQIEKFTHLKDKHAINTLPDKLKPSCGDSISTLTPCYYDIDLNGHVTSVRYIDWMMDTYEIDFLQNNYPKQLSINYLKETLINDSLTISKHSEDNIFTFDGFNQIQDCPAFRGKITF